MARRAPETGTPALVLVVDDEDVVRRLFVRVLRGAGFEVIEASDGREGLARIAEHGPEVVVLDNRMPDLTGLDVLTALRADERTTTLPVILVTGQDEVDDRVLGLETGANDYVAKPLHPAELVARVRAQLRGREAWLDAVERSWRERAAVIEALGRIEPGASVEETAGRVCETLIALSIVERAALLGFVGDSVTVLARHGVARTSGEMLPRALGLEVRRRAQDGPWSSEMTLAESAHGDAVPSAFAPLVAQGQTLGVLALGFDAEQPGHVADSALATAIDLAQAVAAVLAPTMVQGAERSARRATLEGVLEAHAFAPVFQPVVELASGKTVGYEALTRFADGTSPDVRFAEATAVGLGIALERATLDAAVEAATSLPATAWISLNASPALVLEQAVLAGARARCPRQIVIELTERDPIDDYAAIGRSLAALEGMVLAVDDAGAGYASLRHILTLHPEYIKLDMTWVRELDGDTARQAIVVGINHFARLTECRVVAEGIETEAEAATLRDLGVELGQGYLFGLPAPATEFR
jgi:EAL domain-containing protein (putative c-di-GMP-specific phosphodiesterase class I)/FixJ family two-component response regulator